MRSLSILVLLALAACGADGAPIPPGGAPAPGVTVTGEPSFGVVAN